MKKILLLVCTLYLAYADNYIKNIENEICSIKKFNKYKDAPQHLLNYNVREFVDSNSVILLGWSKNNYLAYFTGSDGVNMSDYGFGFLIIKDIDNDKVIHVDDFKSLEFYELEELYKKYEKEIKKTLKKYHIKVEKNLFIKKDKRFSMKNIYKKAPYPMGFGHLKNYLESIRIYVDKKGKKELCAYSVMNTETLYKQSVDINYRVLDASLLGVVSSPFTKNVSAVAVAYVQTNNAEGNSVDIKIMTCHSSGTKVMRIDELPNYTIYSFCKSTGIKESDVMSLNPWINKKGTNILPDSEIFFPILDREENK